MLFALTSSVAFLGVAASLWLALYLPARGLPRGAVGRAMGVLLTLSCLFLWGYIGLYRPMAGGFVIRAAIVIVVLALWNDLAQQVLPPAGQQTRNWRAGATYLLAALTTLVLLASHTTLEQGKPDALWIATMGGQPSGALYAAFLACSAISILFSALLAIRMRAPKPGIYFHLASVLAAILAVCELAAMISPVRLPSLIEGIIGLCGVVLLAIAASGAEDTTGRAPAWRDLPVSALAAACLLLVYVLLAWEMKASAVGLSLVAMVAIVTHSIYDRVRHYLDRQKTRQQAAALADANGDEEQEESLGLDASYVSQVEHGLRNLTDCISLGRSALPARLGIADETHIKTGKAVQRRLLQAIEALRPAGDLSKNPLPRDCYSYVILHDAYWEGAPNREIMLRLNISEGTFHRTRRAAVRAVARSLLELHNSGSGESASHAQDPEPVQPDLRYGSSTQK